MAKNFLYLILLLFVCANVRAQNPIFGSSITLSGDSGHTFPSYTQTWLLDSGTRANDTLTFSTVAPDSAQVWMYDGHGHIAWTTVSGGGGGLSQIYGVSPISITGTDTVNISGVLVTAPTSGSQNTIIPVGAIVGLTLEQPAAFSANAATYIGSGGSPTHVLFDALGIAPVVAGGTGLATLPAHDVMAGNGTGTPNFIAPSTSGNVLESNGTDWISGALSFADSSRAANKSDTANMQHVITFSGSTTGLTPATATSGAITLGGTLAIANGGTGAASTSQNFVFAGPTSGSGAPSFRALVSGDIPSLSYLSNVLTTTGDIIYSSSGSTASRLGIGSTNQILTVVSGIPSWQPAPSLFSVAQRIDLANLGCTITPALIIADTTTPVSGTSRIQNSGALQLFSRFQPSIVQDTFYTDIFNGSWTLASGFCPGSSGANTQAGLIIEQHINASGTQVPAMYLNVASASTFAGSLIFPDAGSAGVVEIYGCRNGFTYGVLATSGTNQVGGPVTIAAGAGTGRGASGQITLRTAKANASGSTVQTLGVIHTFDTSGEILSSKTLTVTTNAATCDGTAEFYIVPSNAAVSVALTAPTGTAGRIIYVRNQDATAATTTLVVAANSCYEFIYDGSAWVHIN